MIAVFIGNVVWVGIAGVFVVWVLISQFASSLRLPTLDDAVGWFLRAWVGRSVLLLAWAVAGWHLFCQRP